MSAVIWRARYGHPPLIVMSTHLLRYGSCK